MAVASSSSPAPATEPGACFVNARARAMARLENSTLDKAPAGGVDVAALPLVEAVNASAQYFTTSTCAGRCAVYAAPAGGVEGDRKRGGRWLYISHDGVTGGDVAACLEAFSREARAGGEAWTCSLKYEPPIAHVRCASLEAARRLLGLAVGAGYRESGCGSMAPEAPVVAIRSVGSAMDAPLGEFGASEEETRYLPSAAQLGFLSREAVARLRRDRAKLDRLVAAVSEALAEGPSSPPPPPNSGCTAVVVAKARAKAVKVALEARGAFLKAANVSPVDGDRLAVPVTADGAAALAVAGSPLRRALDAALAGAPLDLRSGLALPAAKRFREKTEGPSVAALCEKWAEARGAAPLAAPKKLARLGDDAVLVPATLAVPDSDAAFWADLAKTAGASKVFRDAEVAPDGVRSSKRVLLHGPGGDDETWVRIKEGGVSYGFNAATTMFAKGNGTERMRHGALACRGETVVDLYCGIGYFALPMLVRGGAALVHCCEWAPETAKALERNLRENAVDPARYALHVGDNKATAPTLGRVADRVCLGLTPTSRAGWPLACAVIRDDADAVCHVHENVKVDGKGAADDRRTFQRWGDDVAAAFADILVAQRGPGWTAACALVSRVKDYAPRVHHLVADVRCRPPPSSSSSS